MGTQQSKNSGDAMYSSGYLVRRTKADERRKEQAVADAQQAAAEIRRIVADSQRIKRSS